MRSARVHICAYIPPIDIVRHAEEFAETFAEPVAERVTDEVQDFRGHLLVLTEIGVAAERARTSPIFTSHFNRDPLEGHRPRNCQLSVSVTAVNDRDESWSVHVPCLH